VLQDSFSANVGRSKYGNDERILLIGPLDTQANNSRELLLVCREIHVLLGTIGGITAIRWYFEGLRSQSKEAVATPDELPWTQT
jgi:hypothetical protein